MSVSKPGKMTFNRTRTGVHIRVQSFYSIHLSHRQVDALNAFLARTGPDALRDVDTDELETVLTRRLESHETRLTAEPLSEAMQNAQTDAIKDELLRRACGQRDASPVAVGQ